jgi:tripartite ATP-independent transporter DctM subunit
MLKDNYSPTLACGTVAASGTLGILIPPSIMLILMADQMDLSVGDLFMGAVFPGLVLAALYFAYIVIISFLRPHMAPSLPKEERQMPAGQVVFYLAKTLVPPLLLIFAVLGSIFFGVASLLAAANRKLNLTCLKEVCFATAKTTAFITGAVMGATAFAVVLRGVGGDQVIDETILSLPFSPVGTLIAILAIIFALGFILDWIEITLIILPLLAVSIPKLGFDPMWFTILVAVCLQTSFLTPPVGFALFYMKSAAPPGITLLHIYKGIVPFVILQVIGLAIAFLVPELVTWLPSVAYGG